MNKKQKIITIGLICTIAIILVIIGSNTTTKSNNSKLLQNTDEVEDFIESSLNLNNDIWDYYGVIAKKIKYTPSYDLYKVYGNVKIESIDNNFNEILIWKQFSVDVKVYNDNIITENWDFY